MTSSYNHEETKDYLRQFKDFNYGKNFIQLIKQDEFPVFDNNGKIILKQKHNIYMSPNGTGGLYKNKQS